MPDKSALIVRIRNLQREVDDLMDMVIAIGNSEPEQPVQVQQVASDDWLTVKQVCEELRISDSTFYEWLNQGLLPPGVEFGPRSKRWKMSDIRAWQQSRQDRRCVEEAAKITKRRGRPSRVMRIGAFVHA